jgi:hypothetical protein
MAAVSIARVGSPRRRAEAGLAAATARLPASVHAAFVREPLVDEHCPDTADIDLLLFDDAHEILVERLFFDDDPQGCASADLIHLPAASLDDAAAFAARGVLPHRLLTSRIVHDRDGWGRRQAEAVEAAVFAPTVQGTRISGILGLGYLTVREIGITWDFPALALFWLHMAAAACLAALADALRSFCPNVYTRPFDYTRRLESASGIGLRRLVSTLRLDTDPDALAPILRRVHRLVTARFPEPAWPADAHDATRAEFRYFSAERELEFRLQAAAEMARRGCAPNGVFYLRLLGYALGRIPGVHDDSARGETPGFLRPPRAVLPGLQRLCPEIVGDLSSILAGPEPLGSGELKQALHEVTTLRREVATFVQDRGIVLPALREWVPYAAPPGRDAHPEKESTRVQDRPDL